MTPSPPRTAQVPRSPSRPAALARGLGSLVALASVLIALPIGLAIIAGNPLPGQAPSLDQLRDALTRPAADDTLLLIIVRDATWLLWAAFGVSTPLEVAARAQGRSALRLPGLGSVQHLARNLITSITLMTSAPPAIALASTAPPTATAPVAVADLDAHTVASPHVGQNDGPGTSPGQRPSTAEPGHHTVRNGDTLWEIAERELGDGRRWREIAILNDISNPRKLKPGTVLTLPEQHTAPAKPPSSSPGPDHDDPGGSAPPPGRTADPSPTTSDPSTPAPSPSTPALTHTMPETTPSAWISPLSPENDTQNTGHADQGDEGDMMPWAPVTTVFAVGMVAGGVLTKLAQMRHVQRQHRRPGRRIRLPHLPHVNQTERRLAQEAATTPTGHEAGRLLRVALRAMARGVRQAPLPPPRIVGVHLIGDTAEILLAAPSPTPPEHFAVRPDSNNMCWQLTRQGRVHLLSTGLAEPDTDGDPLPGLITAGRTGPGGHLLVNVEALGVVGCSGPDQLVRSTLRTIAAEASTNPWAGWFDAVLVGFDELAVTEGRVLTCTDLDEALELLARRADAVRRRLDETRGPCSGNTRDLRLLSSGDDALTLLISQAPPDDDQLRRLLTIVDDTGGVAAVVPADAHTDLPASFALTFDEHHTSVLRLDPLQLTVAPRLLAAADYDGIVALLSAAADTRDVAADAPPYTPDPADEPAPEGSDSATPIDVPDTPTRDEPTQSAHARSTPSNATNPLQLPPRTGSPRGGPSPWAGAIDLPSPTPRGKDAISEPTGQPPAPGDVLVASSPGTPAPATELATASEPDLGPHVDEREADQPAGLQIRILGPLEVTGTQQALQPKQLEIVLLLALNSPTGLRNDQLRTLLGPDPDHPRGADSFRQAITRTRRRLGAAADGSEYIIHIGDGIYRLHDAELDWTRFQQLVDEANRDNDKSATKLRQALRLIRGRPLDGCYYWWIGTPLLETMRATIVDAAELLAELDLADGNIPGAGRAARTGLTADSAAEQLWRMVMRAEHAAGNTAGVHEAWSGCLKELAAIDTELEPHSDTVGLYYRLTGRTAAASGH